MRIDLTPDEVRLLAAALVKEAKAVRQEALRHPLQSQDPKTERYDRLGEAARIARRAREVAARAGNT